MYINLSHSSLSDIAEELQSVVKEYLEQYYSENFERLKEHEEGGDYTIDLVVEEVSTNMAEEFHGDMENVINDYFERNGYWQQEAEEAVDKALREADEEAEENKEEE